LAYVRIHVRCLWHPEEQVGTEVIDLEITRVALGQLGCALVAYQ